MTLHLTKITRPYALQVSDRLVTSEGKEFDRQSNKNIIYITHDGIVSIAYTGLAFINGLHTDDWIVEKLRGISLSDLGTSFTGGWEIAKKLDLGQSVELLRVKLEDAFKKFPRSFLNMPFQVIFSGFYLKRVNNNLFQKTPYLTVLNKVTNHYNFEKLLPPRYWYYNQRDGFIETPYGYLTAEDNEQIRKHTESFSNVPEVNADESEDILLETIRKAADRVSTVGKNCLSVLIPLWFDSPIRIKYIPDITSENYESHTAYSPWIICPNQFWRPSEIIGGKPWRLNLCGVSIDLLRLETGEEDRRPLVTQIQTRRKF